MNYNVAIDHPALLAWDGKEAYPRSLAGRTSFGFTFEAIEDITNEVMFYIDAAPASDADDSKPSEIFTVVNEINQCSIPSTTNEPATFIIPAGTKKGDILTDTLPCIPDRFIRLVGVGGDIANVRAVIVFKGKGA